MSIPESKGIQGDDDSLRSSNMIIRGEVKYTEAQHDKYVLSLLYNVIVSQCFPLCANVAFMFKRIHIM